MSLLNGPNEGDWSVFASKVVEERDALRAENEQLQARMKGALELAAELVSQRDEFKQMKEDYDGLVVALDSATKAARKWEQDTHAALHTLMQVRNTLQGQTNALDDAKRMLAIAQSRYAPMVKENEHHRRERDVLETQLLLLRDKALRYVSLLPPGYLCNDPHEDEAMRSDAERELYAMATPRKS